MLRLLGLLTVLAPALAHAQPGAMEPVPPGSTDAPPSAEPIAPPSAAPVVPFTDERVLALARGTHAAAARGDCVGARALGSQVARLDPEFHRAVIRTDAVITQCRPASRAVAFAQQDEATGPDEPERTGTPPVSGGILAGEFLLGGLFTIGGGIGGGYLGAALDDCSNEDDECLGGIILGVFLGGTIMAAVGVNLVGDSGDADGSLGLAIGGAMVGGFVGISAAASSQGGPGALLVLVAAPTLGAMLGHNLHRTWQPQRAKPSIDRRMAVLPSARIGDAVGFTLTGGTF